LAEITGHDGTTVQTLRFSSGQGYNNPSAPGYYSPRIRQPANFRRDIFSTGTTGGSSRIGWGELVLVNLDGDLDGLADWGFDGRSVVLRIGDDGAAYGSFTTVLTGTVEQAEYTWDAVTFRIRDRQEELDKAIQANKYGGTNSLPSGLDGTADDIKGQPKPLAWGRVYNVAPPAVNTSRLVYQVNDGAVSDVPACYDRGVSLTRGADYTSQADMEVNSPAAGNYRVWPAGGYFRLGSSPSGQITADVVQGSTAAACTVGQIVKAIVTGPGGIALADVVTSDITALDAANPAEVGVWVADHTNIREVLDQLAASVGAWWGFDRQGRFRIRRFEAPSGSPVVTLKSFGQMATTASDGDILSLERVASNDTGRGVPAYRVTLSYGKNWTTQANDLAGSVTAARRAWLAEEFRTVVSTDTAVQVPHLLAEALEFESLIVDPTAAQAEADRLLTLHKTRRDRLKVSVKFGPDVAGLIDLGDVVSVQINRFGYSAGKLFRVTGLGYDAAASVLDMDLWG
jgi:hypothetical protein